MKKRVMKKNRFDLVRAIANSYHFMKDGKESQLQVKLSVVILYLILVPLKLRRIHHYHCLLFP
jgi:hypothetical protein